MTFILGLNLSDKLYLAADTRVTHNDKTHSDDALKFTPLLDKILFPENEIGMAVAGNVALATFLREKISEGLEVGLLSPDIRKFHSQIKSFLEEALVKWVDGGNTYVSCCLLFAGIYNGRKKKIETAKLNEIIQEFERVTQEDKEEFTKNVTNNTVFLNDPITKLLNQRIKDGTGKDILEHLELSRKPHIPEEIELAIKNGKDEIDSPDSLIFSAQLDVATKTVDIQTAEWGEFLAYGDRVKKEKMPKGLLSRLELHYGKKSGSGSLDAAILTSTILDYAKDYGITTIGGSVLIMPIDSKGAGITGKDFVPGLYNTQIIIGGITIPLVPFYEYHKRKKSGLDLMATLI